MIERDYELLSAYIDGEINEQDRIELERRLNTEPELRRELNDLRQTVALIKQAAPRRAPRNYTLTPEMVATSSTPPLNELPSRRVLNFPLVSALSTAAAMVLIVLGIVLLASGGATDQGDTVTFSSEQQAPVVADAPTTTAEFDGARLADMTETSAAQATDVMPEIQMEAMQEEAEDDMAQTDAFDEAAGAGVSTLPAPPPTIALTQTVVVLESEQTTLGFQGTATQFAQPRDVPQPTPLESLPPTAQSGIAADEDTAIEEAQEADADIAGDAPPPAVAMQAEATEEIEEDADVAVEENTALPTATITPVETADTITEVESDEDTDILTVLGGIAVVFGGILLVLAGFIYWRTRG